MVSDLYFLCNLAEQPRIAFQLMQPIRVEEMTRVEIPCMVNGSPYPEVKWFNVSGEMRWWEGGEVGRGRQGGGGREGEVKR